MAPFFQHPLQKCNCIKSQYKINGVFLKAPMTISSKAVKGFIPNNTMVAATPAAKDMYKGLLNFITVIIQTKINSNFIMSII